MSPANDLPPFRYQSLQGKSIEFDEDEITIITALAPLEGGEWDAELKDAKTGKYFVKAGCNVLRAERDKLTNNIKEKLLAIQGPYCIYCGMHSRYCGNLEREHIAPKGKKHYPAFVFEPQNLCLACHICNCEMKRDRDVGSGEKSDYTKNIFTIVHPYIDNLHDHIEFAVERGKCLIKTKNKSEKGAQTILIFKLASVERTRIRSGLLSTEDDKHSAVQDERLSKIFFNKYVPKQRA